MSENVAPTPHVARRPRLALLAIAITALACVTAVAFRTPLRSRTWAWHIAHSTVPTERSLYLAAICNVGQQGRWGIAALLAHPDAEVRQYGVLALHHLRTPWAQQRLVASVTDPDPSVRRLAAVGLAIHGDEQIIPTLKWLYQTGDEHSATAACLALERLGTPAALSTLDELTLEPADVARRAALLDALAGVSKPACVPPLLRLLSDHRPYDAPPRSEETLRRAFEVLQASGYPAQPTSTPATAPLPRTIAERAADALGDITGIQAPFSSAASEADRVSAQDAWQQWFENHRPGG
jgi:hypothetical protein